MVEKLPDNSRHGKKCYGVKDGFGPAHVSPFIKAQSAGQYRSYFKNLPSKANGSIGTHDQKPHNRGGSAQKQMRIGSPHHITLSPFWKHLGHLTRPGE